MAIVSCYRLEQNYLGLFIFQETSFLGTLSPVPYLGTQIAQEKKYISIKFKTISLSLNRRNFYWIISPTLFKRKHHKMPYLLSVARHRIEIANYRTKYTYCRPVNILLPRTLDLQIKSKRGIKKKSVLSTSL